MTIFFLGCVRDDIFPAQGRPHRVFTHDIGERCRVRGRGHIVRWDGRERLEMVNDPRQLRCELCDILIGQSDTSQLPDVEYVFRG